MLYKTEPKELVVVATEELLNSMLSLAEYIIYVTGIKDVVGFDAENRITKEQIEMIKNAPHEYYLIPINDIACKCVSKYIENIISGVFSLNALCRNSPVGLATGVFL